MPAAAVIPTPRVSMMDAAVKKSVVMVQLNGVDQGRMWCNGWRIGQGAQYTWARDEITKTLRGLSEAKAALLDESMD